MFFKLQMDDCDDIYNSLVTIPKHTNVSVETIRGFLNAFLSHKYIIDYLVKLNANGIVGKDWVYFSKALSLHGHLVKLQEVLNFNVKKLAQLVRVGI